MKSRRAALQTLGHAIYAKINSLQDRYKTAMGPTGWMQSVGNLGPDFPIIQHSGQKAYNTLMGVSAAQPSVASPKAAPHSGTPMLAPGQSTTLNGVTIKRIQ